MPHTFTIPGPAVPQGRPRLTTRGGHAHAYDPKRSRDYKLHVKQCITAQLADVSGEANPFPLAYPLKLTVMEFREPPKSWSRRRREAALAGRILPTTKPDMSNVLKIIEDALNGVLWLDDSQIVDVNAVKRYNSSAFVELTIHKLEGTECANAPKAARE